MFGLMIRGMFRKCPPIGLFVNTKRFKALNRLHREQQIKKESKWHSIREIVFEKNIQTKGNIDWNQLIDELVEQRLVFKRNFEVDLMSAFNLDNDYDSSQVDKSLFQSLMNFIKEVPNITTNSIAASRYCHFVSEFPQYIDETTVRQIRQTSDQLMDKYSERKVTSEVINDIMTALSKSSRDNCLYAINLLPQLNHKNDKFFNTLINSSLKFKLFDESFRLVKNYTNFTLNTESVSNIVNAILESNISFDETLDLLKTFSKTFIIFDLTLESKFIEIMKRLGYNVERTFIEQNGLCHKCDQILSRVSLIEHNELKNGLRSVMFNKEDNLLLASFPEYEKELNYFNKFMKTLTFKRPLDLVIDGLNIGYQISPEYVSDRRNLRSLVSIYRSTNTDENSVEVILRNNILENYENILIIGRKHMKHWKKLNALLESNRDRISIFYSMNKTNDDTYILYAAIQDPQTLLISSDLYRDYADKMHKINMSLLFQRWLRTHQMLIKDKKYVVFPDQFDYRINISVDNKTIHIPFNMNTEQLNWICCRK